MESNAYKEVYFDLYCRQCKHFNKVEADRPCNECLEIPVNSYSHKPVKYEED